MSREDSRDEKRAPLSPSLFLFKFLSAANIRGPRVKFPAGPPVARCQDSPKAQALRLGPKDNLQGTKKHAEKRHMYRQV